MLIWIVNPFEPVPGGERRRVGRYRALARELCARGHRVRRWTADSYHFEKRYRPTTPTLTAADPYQVRLVHAPAYRTNDSAARLWSHALLAARTAAALATSRERPDVIVVSSPPVELCAAVAAFARWRRIACCVDVTDVWPDSFAQLLAPWLRPLSPLLLAPHRRALRRALQSIAAVVVTPGA